MGAGSHVREDVGCDVKRCNTSALFISSDHGVRYSATSLFISGSGLTARALWLRIFFLDGACRAMSSLSSAWLRVGAMVSVEHGVTILTHWLVIHGTYARGPFDRLGLGQEP